MCPTKPSMGQPRTAGRLGGCQAGAVVQRLAPEHHHVHAADLVDRGCQDAGGTLRIEVLQALDR